MTSITGEYVNLQNANFQNIYVSNDATVQNDLTVSGTVTATDFNGPLTATKVLFNDGSAGTPTVTFLNDQKTGIYRDTSGSNGIAFTTNGTKRLKLDTSVCTLSLPLDLGTNAVTAGSITTLGSASIEGNTTTTTLSAGTVYGNLMLAGDGSSTAPSISFTSTPNAGFYLNGSSVALAVNGNADYTFNDGGLNCGSNQITCGPLFASTGSYTTDLYVGSSLTCGTLTSTGTARLPNGSAATPSLIFSGTETNSGYFLKSTGILSVGINGTAVQDFTSAGPVITSRNGQWLTPSLSTGTSVTALTFATPTTTPTALTNYVTYAASTVNGDTWTINQTGLWLLTTFLVVSGGGGNVTVFITRNASNTTIYTGLTPATLLVYTQTAVSNNYCSRTCTLNAGDVVRIHFGTTAGTPSITTPSQCFFTLEFLCATATTL